MWASPAPYLTLELGCEPGCGDGCGGGGIDCGVGTCWPGDGEDSMVRLLWLTWKWRDLAGSMPHTHTKHPLLRQPILSALLLFKMLQPGTSLSSGFT